MRSVHLPRIRRAEYTHLMPFIRAIYEYLDTLAAETERAINTISREAEGNGDDKKEK